MFDDNEGRLAARPGNPYEGNEPYIFVSYRHKSWRRVYPVIKRLMAEGYRVWYDEGIEAGSEWQASIQRHIEDCAVLMPFICADFSDSKNCRREVMLADKWDKTIIPIFLDDAQLKDGLDITLIAHQAILKYQIPTEALFYERLFAFNAKAMQDTKAISCRAEEVSQKQGRFQKAEQRFSCGTYDFLDFGATPLRGNYGIVLDLGLQRCTAAIASGDTPVIVGGCEGIGSLDAPEETIRNRLLNLFSQLDRVCSSYGTVVVVCPFGMRQGAKRAILDGVRSKGAEYVRLMPRCLMGLMGSGDDWNDAYLGPDEHYERVLVIEPGALEFQDVLACDGVFECVGGEVFVAPSNCSFEAEGIWQPIKDILDKFKFENPWVDYALDRISVINCVADADQAEIEQVLASLTGVRDIRFVAEEASVVGGAVELGILEGRVREVLFMANLPYKLWFGTPGCPAQLFYTGSGNGRHVVDRGNVVPVMGDGRFEVESQVGGPIEIALCEGNEAVGDPLLWVASCFATAAVGNVKLDVDANGIATMTVISD